MIKKFGIREVVAIGIGTALFVVLTEVMIPLVIVPNTALQPRMAIMAFLSAVFGPIVGGVVGLLGHALGDAMFYGSIWWSWVIPEAIVGVGIGLFAPRFKVMSGGFDGKACVLFNIVQVIANAVALVICAPILDILIYKEPANKVFAQGRWSFIGDIVIIGILGSILMFAYSKVTGSSSTLKKEG